MTVEELISRTNSALADISRQTKAAEIAGTPPSEIPGAEHDKPVPAEATKADPEVADGSMGPDSAYNEGGKTTELNAGSLFEADESVLEPEKKPETTSDANAKEASDTSALANELLAGIRAIQKEAAASMKSVKKAEIKADAKAKEADLPKLASDQLNIEFDTEFLSKLACEMLATEEGAKLAEDVLTKLAGAQAAEDTLNYIAKQAEAAEQFQKGAQAAEDMIAGLAEQQGAADAEAAIADAAGAEAEAQGAADAEAIAGADIASEAEDQITEQDFVEALSEMVNSGEITEDQAQAALAEVGIDESSAQPTDIDVAQLASDIENAIDSGEISLDEAEALVQELSANADPEVIEALQEEVAPAEVAPAEDAAPAEAAALEETAKEAEAHRRGIIDIVHRIKSASAKKRGGKGCGR